MVRICYADIRRGVCGDVGYDIVVDLAVVRIKPDVDLDIRIDLLKIRDRLMVYIRLGLVRVILSPECDLEAARIVEFLRDHKLIHPPGAVTAGERKERKEHYTCKKYGETLFHPFVPPLETPSMILFLKIRNMTMSGTEMTTTAAIIAGMFSLPNPFSRISWIPFETRK